MIDAARLKTTLQKAGLQSSNQPLYQLLNQLIDDLTSASKSITSITGSSSITITLPENIIPPQLEDQVIEDNPISAPFEQLWRRTNTGIYYADGNVGIGTLTPANKLHSVDATAAQAIFTGWTNPGASGNANPNNGEIILGDTAAFQARFRYDGFGSGHLFIDNSWDDATADIYFRTRTAGTAVNGLVVRGNGRVGVGIVTPSTRMEVKQTDNTDTSPTFRVSRTASAGDFLPIAAFGGGANGDLLFNTDSSGINAFTTWTVWDITDNRWEAQATTTVAATQIFFSTDGSIAFKTQPSAAVTAGDPLTFNDTLTLLGNGNINIGGKAAIYNGITTAGFGLPAIYGENGATAQTGDVASVSTYTVGASDGDFLISCNVNVTVFTAGTQSVQCTYTDETNTPRTLSLTVSSITGTFGLTVGATGAYEGVPLHIRAKASTAITIKTVGTLWNGTYNVRGAIIQIG